MDTREDEARSAATLRFVVPNFSKLRETTLSPPTYIRNLPWKIMVKPRASYYGQDGQPTRSLGFFLQCNGESDLTTWSCNATADLRLISQKEGVENFSLKIQHRFHSKQNDWGYSYFMDWKEVLDTEKGFIKDDTIILEVSVTADAPIGVRPLDQSLSAKAAVPPEQAKCVVCLKPKEIVKFEPCEHKVCCKDCCLLTEKCLTCDAVITRNTTESLQILSTVIRQCLQRERHLENKLQEMEEANRCSICLERPRNVAFMCGHGACVTCAQKLKTCHMCRATITKTIQLY